MLLILDLYSLKAKNVHFKTPSNSFSLEFKTDMNTIKIFANTLLDNLDCKFVLALRQCYARSLGTAVSSY